jgi:hypothetical protein
MTVKIMIDLAPFSVPESVQLCIPDQPQDNGPTPGLTELFDFTSRPKLALSEIDADSLAELCDQFRRAIFEKAGKADPKLELKTKRTGVLWVDEMETKEKDPIPDKDWVAMGHQMIDNAIQKRSDHQ